LDFSGVAHEIFDEDGKPGCRIPDEFLIQRSIVTLMATDDEADINTG
jgi:hypothetical protein